MSCQESWSFHRRDSTFILHDISCALSALVEVFKIKGRFQIRHNVTNGGSKPDDPAWLVVVKLSQRRRRRNRDHTEVWKTPCKGVASSADAGCGFDQDQVKSSAGIPDMECKACTRFFLTPLVEASHCPGLSSKYGNKKQQTEECSQSPGQKLTNIYLLAVSTERGNAKESGSCNAIANFRSCYKG